MHNYPMPMPVIRTRPFGISHKIGRPGPFANDPP